MDFLHILITAPVSLVVLFVLSKFIGNKQMANLNLFDYINGITIGSIAAEMATNGFDRFLECLSALVIYAGVVILLSYIRKNLWCSDGYLQAEQWCFMTKERFIKRIFLRQKLI